MPYIRGRYYMNPVVGDALEAARKPKRRSRPSSTPQKWRAATQAKKTTPAQARPGANGSNGNGSSASGSGANSNSDAYAKSAPGPIHRVEIEAAELVPAHSGRAQRGFVARIHRRANGNAANASAQDSFPGRSNSPSSSIANGNANASASSSARNSSMPDATRQGAMHPAPETHVFSNHNDLTNFLHDQFAEDCK